MTPSLPTFPKAVAIKLPIASSLFEEIAATCLIISLEFPTLVLCFSRSLTIASTALSIPLFKSIGLAPAATFLSPSFTIA